jgi:hypothetical protein
MMNTAPEHWSRAFFKLGSNCDSVDNNLCESFNHCIIDARFLPVISMNEAIRRKVMVKIQENRAKAEKWKGTICPNIFKKLKMNIVRSGNCYVLWNGQDGFEVQEKEHRRYTVNLQERTCTCRYWQISGLPCCHAISSIYMASKQLDDFIAPCFKISEYISVLLAACSRTRQLANFRHAQTPSPCICQDARKAEDRKKKRTRRSSKRNQTKQEGNQDEMQFM